MRDLHIIMPMAGAGSRFAKAGFTTPKPLIPVDGKPMFIKALSALDPIQAVKHYTIIIREEHDQQYGLAAQLKALLPEANIVISNEPPRGALVDALRAEPYLKPDEGVLIMDCDIWLGGESYFKMIEESLSDTSDIDGGLLVFTSDQPRFSYAEVDEQFLVKRTAEKQVISSYAIAGGYFVARADTFIEGAHQELAKPLGEGRPEYFISYLYNTFLEHGKRIKAALGSFISFGTPEELAAYEASSHQDDSSK